MNFNSPQYLFFLPVVALVFASLRRREGPRDLVLLVASYMFYMSWNWKYAGLIAFSTLVDFQVGKALGRSTSERTRWALVTLSLVTNLGLLALFKYWNFFLDTANDGLALLGAEITLPYHELLLPVGLSFYTFQTLSYTIDV